MTYSDRIPDGSISPRVAVARERDLWVGDAEAIDAGPILLKTDAQREDDLDRIKRDVADETARYNRSRRDELLIRSRENPALLEQLREYAGLAVWRTLADISDDPPPELLLGMLSPDGTSLFCAAPGTGKGSTGSWLGVELQRLGLRVGVYDAERRPREWSRRVSGLGGDRAGVVYFDPSDLGPEHAGAPIWVAIERIREIVVAAQIDVLIVDSILPALNVDERRLVSDPSVPFQYEAALTSLGIPAVSFAHPPKGQPEGEPFGSFGWVAAHRLTWLGVRLPGEEHRVRWRVRKANERGHVPGVLLRFAYRDNTLVDVAREDDDDSTRDWLLAALVDGAKTIGELVALEAETTGDYLTAEGIERAKARLGKALYRMKNEGWVAKAGKDGKATKWGVPLRDAS